MIDKSFFHIVLIVLVMIAVVSIPGWLACVLAAAGCGYWYMDHMKSEKAK